MEPMQIVARVCGSFDEADRADAQTYREITPDRRVELALYLFDSRYASADWPQRMERVAKLVKRCRKPNIPSTIQPEK